MMKFCSTCGGNLTWRTPAGDNLPRHVCDQCGAIHYVNPKIVVGAVVENDGGILLCRRTIEPRHGFWTLPAGFMENGESSMEGAARETWEEACARIAISDLFTLINVPHINQVHLMYRAHLLTPGVAPGEESLEVCWFSEEDIPWNELAFRTVSLTLEHYLEDRRRGRYGFHSCELTPGAWPKPR